MSGVCGGELGPARDMRVRGISRPSEVKLGGNLGDNKGPLHRHETPHTTPETASARPCAHFPPGTGTTEGKDQLARQAGALRGGTPPAPAEPFSCSQCPCKCHCVLRLAPSMLCTVARSARSARSSCFPLPLSLRPHDGDMFACVYIHVCANNLTLLASRRLKM